MLFIGVSFHASSWDTTLALSHQSRRRWQLAFFVGNSSLWKQLWFNLLAAGCKTLQLGKTLRIIYNVSAWSCRLWIGRAEEHEVGLDERVLNVFSIGVWTFPLTDWYLKHVIYNSPLFKRTFPNSLFFFPLYFKFIFLLFKYVKQAFGQN